MLTSEALTPLGGWIQSRAVTARAAVGFGRPQTRAHVRGVGLGMQKPRCSDRSLGTQLLLGCIRLEREQHGLPQCQTTLLSALAYRTVEEE